MKRHTSQFLMPVTKEKGNSNSYDINPAHILKEGTIEIGYDTLAERLSKEKVIILDGYVGVDWEEIIKELVPIFKSKGHKLHLVDIQTCLKPEAEIGAMVDPYLGGDDPIFGKKTSLELADYFGPDDLKELELDQGADINLVYGTGASQSGIEGFLVYFDLPKNELQFRMRANMVANLGFRTTKNPKQMYKHFYFVDWVVLNKEKKRLLPQMDIIVDQQRPGIPTWMDGNSLRAGLSHLSTTYFRVRPWFEPGVWGGQWMKKHFSGLNPEVPNYAWSFEMIVPENGLVFLDKGTLLEVSFDMLMFQEKMNVLGKATKRFQDEFPIRFDFLDTFQGGNLSVQCHPSPDYIKTEFGENFTQDETYYILDAAEDAVVYLGFQEDINKQEFREALEWSYRSKEKLDIEKYIQKLPAKKHDLFLIPHGTVHCSGINNMVLEISATPYIFTFKMYDWQRLDLDGNPRPLNIEHAFNNLDFDRRGSEVEKTLVSNPEIQDSGKGWKKVHLPTHPDHFYEIYRYEFEEEVVIETLQQCHVLMLVEGTAIELDLVEVSQRFHYAETFAVPAATGSYKLVNKGRSTAKVIISFVKQEACQ